MSLTLNVTSTQSQSLGADSTKVFNERGGSIGRVQENDWVLPDQDRFVSSRHVVIDYQDGRYFLQDVSANGVYINNWEKPIDRDKPTELKDGDVIAIGNYEIEVSLTKPIPSQLKETDPLALLGGLTDEPRDPFARPEANYPPLVPEPPPSPPKVAEPPRPVVPHGVYAHGAREHIPEVLDPLKLLDEGGRQDSPAPVSGPIGEDFLDPSASRQPTAAPDSSAASSQFFAPPKSEVEQIPDDWDASLAPPASFPGPMQGRTPPPAAARSAFPRPQGGVAPGRRAQPPQGVPAATPRRPASASAVAAGTVVPEAQRTVPDLALLRAFMHGAGLESEDFPTEEAAKLMRLLGAIFRQVVQDIREVLLARANLKAGFRMEMTMIKPLENNPLKFSVGGMDDTLQNLLLKKGSGYMPPMEAFHEGFQDIKDHQVAMMAGMRAAFDNLLHRFNPEVVESRLRKRGGGLFRNKKADYWEAHKMIYKEVLREAEDDFQYLFGKEFAEAYEEQIQVLCQARGQSSR